MITHHHFLVWDFYFSFDTRFDQGPTIRCIYDDNDGDMKGIFVSLILTRTALPILVEVLYVVPSVDDGVRKLPQRTREPTV